MKKFIIFCLVAVAFSTSSMAQGFRLGVKVGGNMNKVEGQSFNDGFKFAYHAGAFAEIDFSKKIGIQPEVIWNQLGGVPANITSVYSTATNVTFNSLFRGENVLSLDYLSIPILFRYTILGGYLTLNAGPQFGILLQQDKSMLANGAAAFKSGDFSVVAGAQLNILMLRVYGRYNIGMTNINNIDQRDKWTSQQIQVGLGLKL
ncbi:MAG: porin family protein [Sediminibacterium sp.]